MGINNLVNVLATDRGACFATFDPHWWRPPYDRTGHIDAEFTTLQPAPISAFALAGV
jgi:hypothetical protein